MAIVQISKIQQRSGNIVDLPQLDEAEFGWASDAKRLFIGKTVPNENIEVLTSYSNISFSQIDGSGGNLDIDSANLANGQVMTYDGSNWVNRGGDIGGLIDLGDVANVKIEGGAIGYVLETDGTGNLSWTPKSTIVAYMLNATQANPCVITTTEDNFFTDAQEVTITGVTGMTQLNGNTYYANVLTANTFSLYSDVGLTTPVNSSAYGAFPNTTATATAATTNQVTVGSSAAFSLNDPIIFLGTTTGTGITEGVTYYVKTIPSGTTITISETAGGAVKILSTASGLSLTVYVPGGRIIAAVSGSGATTAGGSNTTVQFNNNNILDGDADFTWNFAGAKVLTVNGNANVNNLNATTSVIASTLTSNVATGTAPITVTSTTRVANLNVSYSNVSDFNVITTQTTGTFYPVFVNANTTANYALGSNANIAFNAATGNLSATILNANGNVTGGNLTTAGVLSVTGNANVGNIGAAAGVFTANITGANIYANSGTIGASLLTGTLTTVAQPNITSVGTLTSLAVTGNVTAGNVYANSGTIGATLLTGTLTTAAQPNITSVGTLSSLTVTANVTAGNVYANSGTIGASLLTGTLTTNAQPNVTSVGTLTSVAVTGNVTAGNVYANSGTIGASLLTGTLTTAAQPNITSVGTLTSLGVTGNITSGNVYANSGTIGASLLTGTLTTAAQPNITSVGSLTSLTVTGNVSAGNVSGTLLAGTLSTAAQPNVTSVGTLTSLGVTGNITAGNVSVSTGTITLGTLTTGGNTTAGTITGNWSLSSGSRLIATYADLAEYYRADQDYAPGTVLEFGGEYEVTLAEDGTNKVAGVVSTDPAYVMNSICDGIHPVAIALQGRVPVKVRGKIRKGDMMISGGNGYARPSSSPMIGSVIGKALENFDGAEGIIEIAIGRL
jgi:hypothetical protein